ncbi:MAG: hypothetical protein LBS36_02315 [Oscillospiraceae bacterium]|jgi:sugar phosphate isomerase/epimerase|nr:hypothetical protein [Oscillospiraceae bacterium]
MKIGLQTFTTRALMKTDRGVDETFSFAAEQGLTCVELAVDYLKQPFTAATAKMIAAAAARHGIQVASCQIRYKTAAKDPSLTAEYMHILGAQIISNSVIDLTLLTKGKDGILRYCESLNALAQTLTEQSILLSHHNHHYEFLKYEGESVLNIMRGAFSGLFTLDTYWCQKGGGNVLTILDDFEGRIPILHLRDFQIKPLGLLQGGSDCEAGEGNLPFAAILKKAGQCGVRFGMIEQKTKTPKESVQTSAEHLLSLRTP